jgi:flagellar hook-associated protein 2
MTISSLNQLDPSFTRMINAVLEVERQPLVRVSQQRDQLNVRRGLYNDINSRLADLQSSVKTLLSSSLSYAYTEGRQAVVSNTNSATVLTASATATAASAVYALSVTQLAQAHRVNSSQQASASAELGLSGSFELNGATIAVAATDSLNTLASKINTASYAAGQGVKASVVDRRLVLEHASTGSANTLSGAELAGGAVLQKLGLKTGADWTHVLQKAGDAAFTVNGLPVTRAANTGLTDVIEGLTLNLAADAAGKTATLTVGTDTGSARMAIDTFLTRFNSLQTYLQDKTRVDTTTSGGVTTYTRGPLSSDSIFASLRGELFTHFISPASNAGALQSLREIGLSIDDNLQAKVTDSAKLEAALAGNRANVVSLLDAAMTRFDQTLSRFTQAGSGYMQSSLQAMDVEISEADQEITALNKRLTERRESLTDQYATMQAQIMTMQYELQQFQSMYGGFSRFI